MKAQTREAKVPRAKLQGAFQEVTWFPNLRFTKELISEWARILNRDITEKDAMLNDMKSAIQNYLSDRQLEMTRPHPATIRAELQPLVEAIRSALRLEDLTPQAIRAITRGMLTKKEAQGLTIANDD